MNKESGQKPHKTVINHDVYMYIANKNRGSAFDDLKEIPKVRSKYQTGRDARPEIHARLKIAEEYKITSVVFAALAAEALINHYARERLPKTELDAIDHLGPVKKWIVVPKLAKGKGIDPKSKAITGLHDLVGLRNKLAHYKPHRRVRISMDDIWKAIETVHKLSGELNKIDRDFNSMLANW